jgi:hypothetical protein
MPQNACKESDLVNLDGHFSREKEQCQFTWNEHGGGSRCSRYAHFSFRLFEYLNGFSGFDVRIRAFMLVFVIPSLLNVLFIWLCDNLAENLLHLGYGFSWFLTFFRSGYIHFLKAKGLVPYLLDVLGPIFLFICLGFRVALAPSAITFVRGDSEVKGVIEAYQYLYLKDDGAQQCDEAARSEKEAFLAENRRRIMSSPPEPRPLSVFALVTAIMVLVLLCGLCPGSLGEDVMGISRLIENVIVSVRAIFLLIPIGFLCMICVPRLREPLWQIRFKLRPWSVKGLVIILDCL